MGFPCTRSTCCFCCLYKKWFPAAWCLSKNKTSPGEPSPSPPPSIALTIASRSLADEESIQDQLTAFHFGGQLKSPSGRRYSHPNQAPYVEEYERRKSNPGSPAPSLPHELEMEGNGNKVESPPPQSPVMQYPVIPPGRLM